MVVHPEVEKHGEALAAGVEVGVLLDGYVDLSEQHRIRPSQQDEVPELLEEPVTVSSRVGGAGPLHHVRHRVHSEAGHSEPQPEPDDPVDLLTYLGISQLEVWLVTVEGVAVVLLGHLVPCPDPILDRREDLADPGVMGFVGPDVVVAERGVPVPAGLLEPGMLGGRVLRHQIDHHPKSQVLRGLQQVGHVGKVAEPRVDGDVVHHVIAAVAIGRTVEREQPDAVSAEAADVLEPLGDTLEVTPPVTVGVAEEGDVDLVDHRVAVPQGLHQDPLAAGRYAQARRTSCVPRRTGQEAEPSICWARYCAMPTRSMASSWLSNQSACCSSSRTISSKTAAVPWSPSS